MKSEKGILKPLGVPSHKTISKKVLIHGGNAHDAEENNTEYGLQSMRGSLCHHKSEEQQGTFRSCSALTTRRRLNGIIPSKSLPPLRDSKKQLENSVRFRENNRNRIIRFDLRAPSIHSYIVANQSSCQPKNGLLVVKNGAPIESACCQLY